MEATIIRNAKVINEGSIQQVDVLIKGQIIEKIAGKIDYKNAKEINADGLYLMPGIIDDQVHFREPGLTYKACIYTESKAALAGGVTSFMEMPNTNPPAISQDVLQDKYDIAALASWVNYSFFMGASNDNLDEVLRTNEKNVCGIKVFMGSSTGNMLVDNKNTLEKLFSECPMLIATHCEDEATIRQNQKLFEDKFGTQLSAIHHPQIRTAEGCLISSKMAVALAKKHGTRLHILHISTKEETELFSNELPLIEKKITAEACVHHMYFDDSYYETKGNLIKCNPAIKHISDRDAIRAAVLDDRIDVIATDHAPHTMEEKKRHYLKAPSGLPLVQHSLHMMLKFVKDGVFDLPFVVKKMCHNPSDLFRIDRRGFIKEGYFADLVLFDLEKDYFPEKNEIYSKVKWTPLAGEKLAGEIQAVFVNGKQMVNKDEIIAMPNGRRLLFNY